MLLFFISFRRKICFSELAVKRAAKKDYNLNLFQEVQTHRTGISFNLCLSTMNIIKIYIQS